MARSAGLHDAWPLNAHGWVAQRPILFWWFIAVAGLLAALHNLEGTGIALLGLSAIAYAGALEIHNTFWTFLAYVGVSFLPCLAAILVDLQGDPDQTGFMSLPVVSLLWWGFGVSVVAVGWLSLPLLALGTAIKGYRVKAVPRTEPAAEGAVDLPHAGLRRNDRLV